MPHSNTTRLSDQEIADLVSIWIRRLSLFARQWTDSVDDVVQEVFLKLYRLEARPDDIAVWLFKTTRSVAVVSRHSETARGRN